MYDVHKVILDQSKEEYLDDLSLLQFLLPSGLVKEYDFSQHVASDIGTDQVYLLPDAIHTQDNLDSISHWINDNEK